MKIIVRACGERTEKKCIELASLSGDVIVIRETPFAASLKKTYEIGKGLKQKWLPVIDADVLLTPCTIEQAIKELDKLDDNIFCLDGKTKDKLLCQTRRAGVHIYRVSMLERALKFIDFSHIKPETWARKCMESQGFRTHVGNIVFGLHDYEQFYCDIWRKAVTQTKKLQTKIKKHHEKKWKERIIDLDYKVILHARKWAKYNHPKILMDKNRDYDAVNQLQKMGLTEKGAM